MACMPGTVHVQLLLCMEKHYFYTVIVYRAVLVLVLGLGIDIILYLNVYSVCIRTMSLI